MFRGRFEHTIDSKGRISIPSKFREILRERYEEERVIITTFDQCLVIYPYKEWAILEAKAINLSMVKREVKSFIRFFFSGATECNIDRLGRILIPPALRNYALLEKEVVLAGMLNKIEVWSKDKWEAEILKAKENFDALSDIISQLGL